MATLRNPKHEIFAQGLARGLDPLQAYIEAGFKPDRRNARALANKPQVELRVAELLERRRTLEDRATERATERLAISKEAAARELAALAFARFGDYVRHEGNDLVPDFGGLTSEQLAGIQDCTISTYVEGKGERAQKVKRVRIKLHDKIGAIMNLARMMGWIVDKKDHVLRVEERLATMTDEELEEAARQLALRARRLLVAKSAELEAAREAARAREAGKAIPRGTRGHGRVNDVEPDEHHLRQRDRGRVI